MASDKKCPKCGSSRTDCRVAEYGQRVGNAVKHGGLLSATVLLPLTMLVAAVDQMKIYSCSETNCGHEWTYG